MKMIKIIKAVTIPCNAPNAIAENTTQYLKKKRKRKKEMMLLEHFASKEITNDIAYGRCRNLQRRKCWKKNFYSSLGCRCLLKSCNKLCI